MDLTTRLRTQLLHRSRHIGTEQLRVLPADLGQRARLSGALDMDLSLYEVDMAIRHGHVQMYGEAVAVLNDWHRSLISHANAMAAWIGEAWRGGATLDAIVLGGGGAELEIVADRIQRLFRHLQVVERPQIAVALGCAGTGCNSSFPPAMRRHTSTIEGHVSPQLRALVEQGGELSSSLRALLIIGAAACGLDLTAVRAEIPDLISARLQPAMRASLLALVSVGGQLPQRIAVSAPVDDDQVIDDDLLGDGDGAGFDV